MPDLLIELFSEEIPARMQPRARADLKRLVTDGLVEAGLTYEGAESFSTPRRLALTVHGLTARSKDAVEERRGPKVGAPDKAVEGFARGAGVAVADLETREEKKGAFHYATVRTPGRDAGAIAAEVIEATIRGFPWPKSMRWGEGSLRWVRPLRRILAILSDEGGARVVPVEVDGIAAADLTEGHRFMAPGAFAVTGFEDYQRRLMERRVVLEADRREGEIAEGAKNLAFGSGLALVEDPGLLTEVAGLVEWPVPLMGAIAEDFLALPPEVLRTSMKEHQKFFSAGRDGRITHFVTVANVEAPDDGDAILEGNSRVLSARLADAKFFWENDLAVAKAGMDAWLKKLEAVTFHAKLGSQAERIARIAALAREIAPAVGADPDMAERAAKLAKADLASEMVYEFPELQGVMGRYYALAAGEPEAVADAARDHYAPLGPSDDVPTDPVSVAVALADKIDTLTGFWAIGETPTGSKDPYALRRAALGVIRMVLENRLAIRLHDHMRASIVLQYQSDIWTTKSVWDVLLGWKDIEHSLAADWGLWMHHVFDVPEYSKVADLDTSNLTFLEESVDVETDIWTGPRAHAAWVGHGMLGFYLLAFLHDRLKVFLRERGIRHDVIDASLAMPGADDLALLTRRATALQALMDTEDGENLIQGFRRADNILRQAEQADGVEYSFGPDPKLAETDEERALFAALDAAEPRIDAAMEAEDFEGAMREMAALRAPVDAFFEAVQVNADSQILRRNRLNLLHRIRAAMLRVADLRRIEG